MNRLIRPHILPFNSATPLRGLLYPSSPPRRGFSSYIRRKINQKIRAKRQRGWFSPGYWLVSVGLACLGVGVHAAAGEEVEEERGGVNGGRKEPLFRFGVIADVQYADIKNGTNFGGGEFRYYRGTLDSLSSAVSYWNTHTPNIAFVAQLGDLIDGQNAGKYGEGIHFEGPQSHIAIDRVMGAFSQCVCKTVHHTIGNHELYNFGRQALFSQLFKDKVKEAITPPNPEHLYYSFKPHKDWRFLVLDSYDISIEGRDEDTPQYLAARELINNNNPNVLNGGNQWFKGIPPERQRFVPYNGALSKRQLRWMRNELKEAEMSGERAVILTHVPLHPGASSFKTVIWNYPEVMDVLNSFNCVSLVLAGHHHPGGYLVDSTGCHHVTIQGSLTHKIGSYGVVEVYGDRIELRGQGALPSRIVGIKTVTDR